jgi:RHS repeat-associated protein
MGRLIGQYQPYFDTSAPNVLAPPPQDPILAVVRGYDVLDRETAVRTPIAPTPEGPESYSFATTTTTYSIGKINTTARLMATISDPNVIARGSSPSLPGYAREEYRGVRGNLLRVVEKNRLSGSGVVSTLPTSYGYNALGELTSATDSNGNITVATYDTAGRIVTLISPDAGRTDYLFDIAGNLAAKQTANLAYGFQRIYYEYDFNRLKKIDYPNSADVTFTYGAWTEAGPLSFYRASRIKQETSEAGTKSFRYELLGNINEETWTLNSLGSGPPVERTFRYNYDSFGRLLAVHYPGASEEVVNYSYDVGGNLDAVTGITGTGIITPYVQHIGYDEFEQKTSITLGNGITTYYSYDPYTRRLAGVSSSHRDPALVQAGAPARPFQQITYAYDPVGNLLEVANNAPVDPSQTGAVKVGPVTETFTYDDLYQLKTADGILQESETQQHRYGISFTYDLLSNVTSKTQLSETDTLANGAITSSTTRNDQTYTSTYTYPAGSRPHAVAQISDVVPGSGTVARTFTYDRNGNQKTWQRTSGPSLSRTTTYDDGNRVVSVSQNGATLQESLYDGAGQRLVKRAHESAQTAYFGQYLTVRDGIPTTKHIFAGDVRVASKFIPNDANEECTACPERPSVTYFHSDHLGSTAFATDEEQVLLSRQQYFPSGELWLDQANSLTAAQQPYLFSGKELDVETGLYYFGARYYDPRAGTWTTPDPILLEYMLGAPNSGVHFPRNLALYTYAINNPVVVQDTDGRAWWSKAWKVGKALYKGGDMAMAFADAIENYNTLVDPNASTGERIWAGVQLATEAAPLAVSDVKDAHRAAKAGIKQLAELADTASDAIKGGTYKLVDKVTGQVRRTGMTNNLQKRAGDHRRGKETGKLEFQIDRKSDDPIARRGREQRIYDKHPEADLNKRRPISPKNPRRDEYLKAGDKLE